MKNYLLAILVLASSSCLGILTCFAQTRESFNIHFDKEKEKISVENSEKFIVQKLKLSKDDGLQLLKEEQDELGVSHRRYQHYYKGIKVEHGLTIAHARQGLLTSIHGNYIEPPSLNTHPTLSEAQALQRALSYFKAKQYKWADSIAEKQLKKTANNPQATYYPKGEIVICKIMQNGHPQNGQNSLAYKFDIYASDPLSRDYVYIDAHDGSLVLRDAIIKHTNATGTAATRYSGSRTINTELTNGTYRLHDNTRGGGIVTYKLDANNNISEVTDNDNNWTSAEFNNAANDNVALDAHWGAMMAYDYWSTSHNRNSFDNQGTQLTSYVHYGGFNYENAFWDGSSMVYGDGGGNPFASLDICGHEVGHGITQYTCNLVYSYESGALNEGFSDIWGACLEYFADPTKKTWLIGEDVGAFRSMQNPKLYYQPNTYLGQNWESSSFDNGGVHTNSGVLNYWFYLLSIGGSGTNDNAYSYTVSAIGIDKAAKIAYRTQSIYLLPNSQYYDARVFTIEAATDLYGPNSNEVLQVMNAWDAVGIPNIPNAKPTALTATPSSQPKVDLNWTDNSQIETAYSVERSLTPGKGHVVVATLAANTTNYTDLNVSNNTQYYYRVRALGSPASHYSEEADALIFYNSQAITMNGPSQVTTCNALFTDSGGANGNYSSDEEYTVTLKPDTPGAKIVVAISAVDLEDGFDYMEVYNGPDVNAPLLAYVDTQPMVIYATATNPTGELTFKFISDWAYEASGFQASVSCVVLPTSPTNLQVTETSGTSLHLTWTDNSSDETGFVIERSMNMGISFEPMDTAIIDATNFMDVNIPTNVIYFYRVKAIKDGYQSAYSNVAIDTLGYVPFTEIATNIIPVGTSAQAWGDYDNDGDLDILISGDYNSHSNYNPPGGTTNLYSNNNGTFTDLNAGFAGTSQNSVAWSDYDNDGDLDALITYKDFTKFNVSSTKLYKNDNGKFIDVNAGITNVIFSSTAWGDYDQDGDQDLLLIGYTGGGSSVTKVFRNDAGKFVDIKANLPSMYTSYYPNSGTTWADYDNDGDLDILLCGEVNNNYEGLRIFKNNGGIFANTNIVIPSRSIGLGDYDNDGDLDILGQNTIYKNINNDFSTQVIYDNTKNISYPRFGDYDNDGDLDILCTTSDNSNRYTTRIYRNMSGVFEDVYANTLTAAGIPTWADYDNDGDLDILVTANYPTANYGEPNEQNGILAKLYRNNLVPNQPLDVNANALPIAPTNLQSQIFADKVTLVWDKSMDNVSANGGSPTPSNSLTYNIYIKNSQGKFVVSPMSDITTGKLRKVDRGNSHINSYWIKGLPDGKYYWSVQAIDHGYAASAFAPEKIFYVGAQAVTITSSTISGAKNSEISLPVTTENFTDILSTQFTITWDTSVATFAGLENFNLPGLNNNSFGLNQIANGVITVSWSSPSGEPQTLGDNSTLFDIRFLLTGNFGSTTTVTVGNEPLAIEVIDQNFQAIATESVNGSITIESEIEVQGEITYSNSEAIQGVSVAVGPVSTITNSIGEYKFVVSPALPSDSYTIVPTKSNDPDPLNGIDVQDVATTRRHILQTELFTTPHQSIAADVNQSKTVSTLDIVLIEALILGIQNNYPNNIQWAFVPSDHVFGNDPFVYPQTKTLTAGQLLNTTSVDFTGIKLGDVNHDRDNSQSGRIASEEVVFEIGVATETAAGLVQIPVRINSKVNLSAYQFTASWDIEKLDYQSVLNNSVTGKFGNTKVSEGHLTTLWDDATGKSRMFNERDILFTLSFTKKDIDMSLVNLHKELTISGQITSAKVYDHLLAAQKFSVSYAEEHDKVETFQVYPNPFTETATIKFYQAEDSWTLLTVTDIIGRKVWSLSKFYPKGNNEIVWNATSNDGAPVSSGVYLLKLSSEQKVLKIIKR